MAAKSSPTVVGSNGSGLSRHLTATYVERCREARLRRRPDRLGPEALRLERGDLYAWREGAPPTPDAVRVSVIAEPRSVAIADHRLWWVPRLDQLLQRIELSVSRRRPDMDLPLQREWIATQLAERVRERRCSWEEAALDLLLRDR